MIPDQIIFESTLNVQCIIDLKIQKLIIGKSKFTISNELLQKLLNIISKINDYSYLQNKTELGYRDGWFTKCYLKYNDEIILYDSLSTIYKENPFELILISLRKSFLHINQINQL